VTAPRFQLADELLRRFAASLRSVQLYSPGHPIIARNLESLSTAVQLLHSLQPTVVIGIVGDEVIVDDMPMAKADTLGPLVRRLHQSGVERITIDRGVTREDLAAFIVGVTTIDTRNAEQGAELFPVIPHIRVGRVTVEQRVEGSLTDMATIKRLYADAVSAAGNVWDSAQTEGRPDATVARSMIDGLAQAVAQNRTALLALTTLKNYDNYTFTHMVNVSILTMGQARGLGIDGPLLREFGLAALMHDFGKPKTRSITPEGVQFHSHDVVGARTALIKKRDTELKAEGWRGSLTSAGSWQGCCCCFSSGPGKVVEYNQRHGNAGEAGPAVGGEGARREPREGDPSDPGRGGPDRRPAGGQGRLADPHRCRRRHPRAVALREPGGREARPRPGAVRDRGQGPHLHRRRFLHRRVHGLPAAADGRPDLRGGRRDQPARRQAAEGSARGGHGADQRPGARSPRLR
jgi:putative nucleotidyltransferase with HDIG domain